MAPNDPTPPADHDRTAKQQTKEHLAGARAWWAEAWNEGGVFHEMWEDVRRAPGAGWHGMANWIKAVATVAVFSFVVLPFNGAVDVLLETAHHILTAVPKVQVGDNTSSGVFAVVDQPIRSYIAAHSSGLPISASTIYTLWQLVGIFGLVGGFLRSSGARLTWTAWGAASIATVYSAAPADGRTIATGLAVLAWTAASALALRGLTLRPQILTAVHTGAPQITVQPEIHVPAPASPADDTPDNVHPLPKR
ncbi:hypothetical protein ACFRKB_37300 [Streptomyces scopuliridis]|uniref:hypothetical protein n=1 Tax=Streptomyces scopuliridis TaxID=452529 RepID=UPI0036BEC921